jgi:hypothetical protein
MMSKTDNTSSLTVGSLNKVIYLAHGKQIGIKVYPNGYTLTVDAKHLSAKEVLKMFPKDGEAIVRDQLQAIRELALTMGWKDTAKSTIDDYKGE